MKKPISLLTLCLMCACASAEDEVDRAVWTSHMEDNLPSFLCAGESYFRSCFQIDESVCRSTVAEQTRDCLGRFGADIPERLTMPQEGLIWGQTIGSCVGAQSELALWGKRLDTAECNDPEQW